MACAAGAHARKRSALPPCLATVREQEVGDEPDMWALRVSGTVGRAHELSGHGFFAGRFPAAKV